jgi:hypothetical protein
MPTEGVLRAKGFYRWPIARGQAPLWRRIIDQPMHFSVPCSSMKNRILLENEEPIYLPLIPQYPAPQRYCHATPTALNSLPVRVEIPVLAASLIEL